MDIRAWLRDIGLERYEKSFREHEIDAEVLPSLTIEDLQDLGITAVGHRRKLLNAIAKLRDHDLSQNNPLATPDFEADVDPNNTSPIPDAERRQVATLFADLAGYTKLSSELDAEEVHALLGRFYVLVDGTVKRYGGTIDKHIGDCVMAVFGAPVAHGNDPERAVRSALEIQNSIPALSRDVDRAINVHIGIASGQVMASKTGSSDHFEYTVTGDSVNLASRLMNSAKAGETLISDPIKRALSERLDCDEIEPLSVKGFASAVRAWRLRGWRETVEARRSSFVGRHAELHQFKAALKACRESDCGQTLYVRGVAGIGKTRLIEEFQHLAKAAGFACHTSLVLDFGSGAGRDTIRMLVRSLLDLAPDASEQIAQKAAEQALDVGQIALDQQVFLNDLLDLPQPTALRAQYDAMDNSGRNRGKRATVARLVERTAAGCPLMLVIEDIHWADSLTLQHLAQLVETVASCLAMLVMTSRLEGDLLDQAWRSKLGSSPFMTIDLGPLRQQEAEALANDYIGRSVDLAKRCVDRAAGNPLFLEQLLRYAEDGLQTAIPDSVQNLVQAHTDRLQVQDKRALQAASVFGQWFSPDALCTLIEQPDYSCNKLVAQYLLRPHAGGFLFAHALVRDGVYASLLSTHRRELHERAADWFAGRDPVLRAEHLDWAGNPAAAKAYLEAARWQADAYRYNRALALAERGLELVDGGFDAFELACARGDILRELGAIDASIDSFERARGQAQDTTQACRALLGLAAGMRIVGRFEDGLATLDKAESAARQQHLSRELAQIHYIRGNICFPLGRINDCLEHHQQAQRLAHQADAPDLEAQALGGLADANFMRGRMLTAYDHFRRCVKLAHERGLGAIEIANWAMVGCAQRYTNQLREAWQDSLAAIDAAKQVGNQRAEIIAQQNAWLLRDMARLDEARPHFEQALALARSLGAHMFEPLNLAELAFIASAQGASEQASSLIEEAWSISQETRPTFFGPWVLGVRARITEASRVREDSYREGECLLAEGCVGHNYYFFYTDAAEAALLTGDWDRAERYATALEDYTREEPTPWSDLHIARARALAACGRGGRDKPLMQEIRQLADECRHADLQLALPALEQALSAW